MAECVISQTRAEDGLAWACVVHTHYAPCPHDGQPANPVPTHADGGRASREAAIAIWRLRTRGQRPLVIHHCTFADHHETNGGTDCWCRPDVLLAVDLTPGGGRGGR